MSAPARAAGDDDPGAAPGAACELRREAGRMEAGTVRRARVTGMSWAGTADLLGVCGQAAHRKYGGRHLLPVPD